MQKARMYYVKWVDASGAPKWRSREDAEKVEPLICETVGFRLKDGKGSLRFAASQSNEGDVADVLILPRHYVKELRELVFRDKTQPKKK